MATRGQSHARDRGADSRSAGFPTPQPDAIPPASFPRVPLSTIFSTLCRWQRACPLPPVLPSSLSSLYPPSRLLPPLLAATHLASFPPCCGSRSRSRSLGLFASLSVPCPGEPALSCALVGQTAQAHCSSPPSSLSASRQFLIRVAARVRPIRSSAHRWCGALASRLHRPCIAPSFASLVLMPPAIHICTRVPPLLVPLPHHWNHPMAHVASPTLGVVEPPHTGGPATSTAVCPQ